VSSPLLKHVVPAALVSAVMLVLSSGVALAQAAVPGGREAGVSVPTAVHTGTNVALVIAAVVILAVVVGGVVYAIVAAGRQLDSASAAVGPTQLSADRSEAEHQRKAA
jgi:chromate transport protein ChrA